MTSPGPSAAIQGSNGNGGTAGTNSAVVGIGGDGRKSARLVAGACLAVIALLLALGVASPGHAAAIVGANGGNGGNAGASTPGVGGDGGGNAGSGGSSATPAGAIGVEGTGGGGGRGGGGGGSKGGDSEFGLGGPGSSIGVLPSGGGEEAGGGGGQTTWYVTTSGGGGGGGGGQRGLTISADTATIAAGDTVAGGNGGDGGNGIGNWYADGGGGGGGGIGLVYQGVVVLTVNGAITGGNGGNGGNGDPNFYISFPSKDVVTKDTYTHVIGSFGGSGGSGGTGLRTTGDGATVVVNADIAGGNGGDAGIGANYPTRARGGPAGAGIVVMGADTTVYVNAAVSGGMGGLGSRDGEAPYYSELNNVPGPLLPSTYDLGGAGITGADLTVVLGPNGSITGGLRGNGQDRADAVTFSGGANVFELQADTTSVVGKVVAGGTDDVFRLGGNAADRTFDTALFGTQYQGFETYEKVGLGGWTLTGSGHAGDWAVKVGTLSLDGIMLDGAIDNEASVNANGKITGAISNRAGAWFTLTGNLEANSLITNDGYFAAYGSGAASTFAVTGGAGFDNAGWISLSQSGGIAGDVLDLTDAGLFTGGADSGLALDIDLSGNGPVTSDQLLLGATTGSLQVSFNPDPSKYGALTAGLLVIRTEDGNLQATAMGLQDRGLVDYAFEQIGTDWYVTSSLNAAPLGGIVAGMQGAQGLIDLASRPAALDFAANPSNSCEAGVYTSLSGGRQGVSASTMASDGGSANSAAELGYGGVQFDLDSGCLALGPDGATARVGLVGGLITGAFTDEQVMTGDTVLQSSSDFLAGYAGIYGQFRSGGFVANAQLGYDSTTFDIGAVVAGGPGVVIDGQTTAERFTASGSIGYAFELDGVTITPTVGLSSSHASTGSVQLVDLGGRLEFADRDAVTGFAGLEVAMTQKLDDASIRYFASGNYAEDFGGPQSLTYSDDINGSVELETASGRSRGTVSAGFSYEGADAATFGLRGDLSYVDGRLGTGLTLKAGMSF